MGSPRILLISSDAELAGAIAQPMLNAGCDVRIRSALFEAPTSEPRFDCTVLDLEALPEADHLAIAACIRLHPVLLIADRVPEHLREWVVGQIAPNSAVRTAVDAVRTVVARQ